MQIHLFGSSSPVGYAFRELASDALDELVLFDYSRQPDSSSRAQIYADLLDPLNFDSHSDVSSPSLFVSFAPIWLFASFFAELIKHNPSQYTHLRAVVVCSSSSVLTKRYASNSSDRLLVSRLMKAESLLLDTCKSIGVSCLILRPSIIYGKVGKYCDKNIRLITRIMKHFPLLLVPSTTGYRQPIHANELASVAFFFANQFMMLPQSAVRSQCIAVGGDTSLKYIVMLHRIQNALPTRHPGKNCWLIPIPNRIFYFIFSPLGLLSPKALEAITRLEADLNGFIPASSILGRTPNKFPAGPICS